MTVQHYKISGRRQWVVTVDVPGGLHGPAPLVRGDFAVDGPSPAVMKLVQIEGGSGIGATLMAGERRASPGYVVTWDRPLLVYANEQTTVRAVFTEGSH